MRDERRGEKTSTGLFSKWGTKATGKEMKPERI